MKLLAIIDLDGTLVNISDLHLQAGPEPSRDNRDVYRAWAATMTAELGILSPNKGVLEAVRCLYRGGAQIVYLTSREEIHRDATQGWLNRWAAPPGPLLMRGHEDWRSTAEMKGSIIRGLIEKHVGPVITFDDDANGESAPMYKILGVEHMKALVNLV